MPMAYKYTPLLIFHLIYSVLEYHSSIQLNHPLGHVGSTAPLL